MEHKIDRLWDLPEPVVERILLFIPLERILQLSILSKRWQKVWTLFPLPDLLRKQWRNIEEFNYFVERTLVSRYRQKLSINKFNLQMEMTRESADCDLVNRWIGYAIESNVKELNLGLRPIFYDYDPHSDSDEEPDFYPVPESILTAKSLIELKLSWLNLKSSYSGIINLSSLRKLVFSQVVMDDQIVQALISGCPIVEEIEIRHCYGLKNIHMSGLPKLMAIEFNSNHYGLESFEIEAPNLKKLVLCSPFVTDKWLHGVLSKHLLIESLELLFCNMLKRIKISSDRMKSLTFSWCNQLVELNIFTPNLHGLQYYCGHAINLSSNAWTLSEVCLNFVSDIFAPDAPMDVQKIEFLAKLNHPKLLIWTTIYAKSMIIPKELRETLPSPLYNVKKLELRTHPLRIFDITRTINELVEALLWISPLLEILFIKWSYSVNTNDSISFKFSYENPVHKLKNPSCCKLLPILCWRHCLKTIKIEYFGRSVEVETLKKYFSDNAEILESFE